MDAKLRAERIRRREEADAIDARANRLYDRLNPEPDKTIAVSKHECIQRVLAGLDKTRN